MHCNFTPNSVMSCELTLQVLYCIQSCLQARALLLGALLGELSLL